MISQSNGNGISITKKYINYFGEVFIIPKEIKKKNSTSQSINGKKIKINGYKFVDGRFIKGLKRIKAEKLNNQ